MLFILSGFRQWWHVTLETGLGTCAMWTTQMATDGVSHAYITLTKTGMLRYGSDVWKTMPVEKNIPAFIRTNSIFRQYHRYSVLFSITANM